MDKNYIGGEEERQGRQGEGALQANGGKVVFLFCFLNFY